MRRRLTRAGLFRRQAAPDEFSGRNMNTPIKLYDTHPNQRFPVGSVVTYVDDTFLRLRGTVLGHAAEDRLWVQWPNEIKQEDVEEVVGRDEIQDGGSSSTTGVIGSRRNATTLTFEDIDRFNEEEDDDGDLEYIPEIPDFRDGDPVTTDAHPTNEIHTGELPSEQDPRDKIEIEEDDDYDGECGTVEIAFILPELGDMTDLIEDSITASRLGAVGQSQYTGEEVSDEPYEGKPSQGPYTKGRQSKNPVLNALLQMKDQNGDWLYKNEADAALNYNVFKDKNVQKMLFTYGLSNDEIENFANIRQHQLDTAKEKESKGQPERQYGKEKFQKTPEYSWGQGTGVNLNVSPKNLTTDQQAVYKRMSPERKKQYSAMSPERKQQFWAGMQKNYPQFFPTDQPPAPQQATFPWAQPGYQEAPQQAQQAPQQAQQTTQQQWQQMTPEQQQMMSEMGFNEQGKYVGTGQPQTTQETGKGWKNWPPGGFHKWFGRGKTPKSSRSLEKMRNHVNLIGGLLAMPRTANVLGQTVDLISAIHELDDGEPLDETTRSALRNNSHYLLMATDHLKGVNNRIANKVAGEIEQLYVDALSN